MRKTGWYEKPGVRILEGRWQDFIKNPDVLSICGFDIVYTDTFSEKYDDLRQFFECIPNLFADKDSRFSFFNGLGATSKALQLFSNFSGWLNLTTISADALFYDVYTQISELHLSSFGLNVEWSDVDISFEEEEGRWERSREYFSLPIYRLPIGRMKRSIADQY